jgi:hypothetical protein
MFGFRGQTQGARPELHSRRTQGVRSLLGMLALHPLTCTLYDTGIGDKITYR